MKKRLRSLSCTLFGLLLCPAVAALAETLVYDNGPPSLLQTIWGYTDFLAPSGSGDPTNKSTSLSGNILTLKSGTVSRVYGAFNWQDADAVTGNQVSIEGGTVVESVYGGQSRSGNATNNTVTISNGTVDGNVTGGYSTYGNTTNNTVTISGGEVGSVLGSQSYSDNVTGNTVTISGGTVGYDVYGGYSSTGNVTGNTVTISGGSVGYDVIGGFSWYGNATGNTVTISDEAGGPSFGDGTVLSGGYNRSGTGDAWTGNTLNLKTPISVAGVRNFQFYNFYIPIDMAAGGTMLRVTGANPVDITGSTIAVGINGATTALNIGERITLIESPAGLVSDQDGKRAAGIQGIAKIYEFDLSADDAGLYATAASMRANEQLKALSEGRLAGLALVSEGADLILGPGMYGALLATQKQKLGLAPFAVVSGGTSTYDTGSSIDVDGFHLLAGLAKRAELATGFLVAGAFFEAGWGSYSTENSFAAAPSVRGDGDTSYYGVGILGRYEAPAGPGGLYGEASFRLGRTDTDFRSNDILNGVSNRTEYDSDAAYYGAHLGIGYLWAINAKARLDFSTKYIWTHQNSDGVTIAGDRIEFQSADSHRWRTGARFSYAANETITPYAGAYYDHEFDGEGKARVKDEAIQAPELAGGTGVGELGLIVNPGTKLPLSLDLGVQGYVGQRQGVSGTLRLKFEF